MYKQISVFFDFCFLYKVLGHPLFSNFPDLRMMTKRDRDFGSVYTSQVPKLTFLRVYTATGKCPINGYGGGGPYGSAELEEGHKRNAMGIVSNVIASSVIVRPHGRQARYTLVNRMLRIFFSILKCASK